MAPNIQTQHDPNLREAKNDHLNGFDPIAVFGFVISDTFPDEATIRARYHKLVRLIGVVYRADNRLPYTVADVNHARDNLLSNYRRTVEVTRGYHRPTWNPAADERDLIALLTPVPAGTQAATQPSSYQPPLNIHCHYTRTVSDSEVRTQQSAFPTTGSSSARPKTPITNPQHRQTATADDSSSDDDVRIVSSRSSVSARKDPVSEVTKQEMRQLAKKEDKARLRAKGEANKGKGKDNAMRQANSGGAGEEDDVVYLGTGNETPGYILVGHDRRPGGGGRLMVMCLDCRNHANFYALQPTGSRIGGFRLDRASYDDVDQSPAMLPVLRNIGEIAPAHMRASRDGIKAYYEVMIAQREVDARKP